MTHTTDKNYKKKHIFEPSGTYSEMEKELCECGLPLDIPTMHYYKSSTDIDWQSRFDKKFTAENKSMPRNETMLFEPTISKIKQFIKQELRNQAEEIIKDFRQEVENNTLISEMYGWRSILEMSLERVRNKYALEEKPKA